MQLDDFLFNLHFDIDKVRPVDVEVDWGDAPLPFKLYQGLPTIPLPQAAPLQTPIASGTRTTTALLDSKPGLEELGTFFWYTYGLTQLCHALLPGSEGSDKPSILQVLRRFAPSGGALYPSELYAYLRTDEVPDGLYHYDVAHHRLVLLRAGNYDAYLEHALGHRYDLSSGFGVLFVSTVFWKNYFKYRDFAYRLQGLDAGVLIGQALHVAEACGCAASVCFQFLDRAVNHILGLDEEDESVYAVIPLQIAGHSPTGATGQGKTSAPVTDEALCRDIPPLDHKHYVKSQHVTPYPMLRAANQAAMIRSTDAFCKVASREPVKSGVRNKPVPLPRGSVNLSDFDTACRKRYSPGLDFVSDPVRLNQLATVLRETTRFSYTSDAQSNTQTTYRQVQPAVCIHGIDGIPDGAYLYDQGTDALCSLRPGDVRMELQFGLSVPTVNLFQVPVCLHLVGSGDHHRDSLGYRGYRIQQMETGILLQRLLLTASAIGLGGHPLLGYDEAVCDGIYHFDSKRHTCLIQVPMGRYRKSSRFEGKLCP